MKKLSLNKETLLTLDSPASSLVAAGNAPGITTPKDGCDSGGTGGGTGANSGYTCVCPPHCTLNMSTCHSFTVGPC